MVCRCVVGDESRCGPGQGGSRAGVHDLRAASRRSLPVPRRRRLLLLVPTVVVMVMLPLLLPCTPCGLARHVRTHL